MEQRPALPVLSVGVLITGNLVGAGILALPINTGLSGFGIAIVLMLVFWALMLATAHILANRVLATKQESFDLPSLFGESLGSAGRWVATAANLLILYGLLVAYLSGGNQEIKNTRVAEVYYRIAMGDRVALTADLQYMRDQKKTGKDPEGFIVGLRADVHF